MPVIWVARVCVLARSRSSTCMGSSSSSDTPRSARLSVARSRLNPLSSRAIGPAPANERWLALSETSSTMGDSPRCSAASKPAGTTTTGSASLALRSCASKSAGAAFTV